MTSDDDILTDLETRIFRVVTVMETLRISCDFVLNMAAVVDSARMPYEILTGWTRVKI